MILERNRIYPMDCVEVLKELPSESVDLVIADPPYYRMKGEFDTCSSPCRSIWRGAWSGCGNATAS